MNQTNQMNQANQLEHLKHHTRHQCILEQHLSHFLHDLPIFHIDLRQHKNVISRADRWCFAEKSLCIFNKAAIAVGNNHF